MQSTVKKWFSEKGYGFLNNGSGPDVFVRKENLENCKFLKPGVTVEFDCHVADRGLIAKNVKLIRSVNSSKPGHYSSEGKRPLFGVMT